MLRSGIGTVREQAGLFVLLVINGVGPLAGIGGLLGHAHPLVKHHAHGGLKDVVVHPLTYMKVEGLFQVVGLVANVVRTRSRKTGKIKPPDFIARGCVYRPLLECYRRPGKYHLGRSAIHHFHNTARSVRKILVKTLLGATQHGKLLRIWPVAKLVYRNKNILCKQRCCQKCGHQNRPQFYALKHPNTPFG